MFENDKERHRKRFAYQRSQKKIKDLEQKILDLYLILEKQTKLEIIRSTTREINLKQHSIDRLKDSLNNRREVYMETYNINL